MLELTRRDERLFQDRLDEAGGFFWELSGNEQEFYARLREMLRTAGGRAEFESARQELRRRNAKAFGKLDFGIRLVGRCLRDIDCDPDVVPGDREPGISEAFLDADRQDLEGQFYWGSALAASVDRPWVVGALISLAPEEEIREVREGLVPAGRTEELPESVRGLEPEGLFDRFPGGGQEPADRRSGPGPALPAPDGP